MRVRWPGAFLRVITVGGWVISVVDPLPLRSAEGSAALPGQTAPTIAWITQAGQSNRPVVEVRGVPRAELDALRRIDPPPANWDHLLSVHVESGDLSIDVAQPAMLGDVVVEDSKILFRPAYPLEPGVRYRADFNPRGLPGGKAGGGRIVSAEFALPAIARTPTTVVTRVHPTAGELPENLLKFYVYFSAPMSRGHIYDHIRLVRGDGNVVSLPFLEIDEELWDRSMTRLTLFIDPGRIKRGVRPLEEIGPALEQGNPYVLEIDPDWRDARGLPLAAPFQKRFRVGPADRSPPDPGQWTVIPPKAGSRAPLTISFPEPMDHALAQRLIRVVRDSGETVEGDIEMKDHDRRWEFQPHDPWRPGACSLVIDPAIEDLAGNNIGKPFEVDLFESIPPTSDAKAYRLEFRIR